MFKSEWSSTDIKLFALARKLGISLLGKSERTSQFLTIKLPLVRSLGT
jgi:hypothetical protein